MPIRIKRNILLVIVLMLWGPAAFGQSYPMLHFTLENGLPSNTVYNIYRDSKGFLWISTDKGVARFNGTKFEKFTTFDGLADNEIFYATEDKQNRIWFGTFNGKLCYYKDDTFHNPDNTPFLRQKDKHSHTARVFLERDSSVSISYLDPYYFCNITKDKCTEIQFRDKKDELSYDNIALIEKIDPGKYKIIISRRELIVNTWGATPKVVSNNPLPELGRFGHSGRMQDEPWIFYHDSVWCTSDFKIIKKYPGGTSIDRFFPQMTRVDKLGNVFHLTEQGMYLNDSIHFLSEERTSSMTQDLNGNHWVSVLNSGIYCLHKNFLNYNLYSKAYKGKILYATEIKGKLFFYTDEHQLSTFDNGISKTLFKSGLDPKERQPGGMGFFLDTNFTFYGFIGHLNFVVPNVPGNTSLTKRYYYSLMGDRHSIKEILKSNNRLYINTGFGMRSLNLANYANEHIVNCIKLPDARGERIFAMAKSDDGSIWYSTIDSVFKAQGDVGIAQNQVKGVAFKNFDFFGKTLVGITHDNQLLIYENQNGHFNKYSISEGNIWENLYGIDSTHVLISTNGLYYLLTLTLANGNSPYSLTAVENAFVPLGAEAICVGKSDFFFFKNGDITKIRKSELLNKAGVPVLYFTNIKTGTNSSRIKGPVRLPYETGNITISFSSLSFDVTDPIYQYSLSRDGKDNWINVKGDINLANLGFGSYVLKVRGKTLSNDFGKPIILDLTILRPFWATWWFISASVCIVALFVWLIIRRRIRATVIKKEKEHENHVRFIKSEYKAMNALMNPHFVFNSINNVQSLVNNHDVLNATEYLGIFADLIRQNMHNVSNDVIPLQKEIDLVENYLLLEKLRFEDQLNYSINIAENMFLTDIMVAPLLLQPLVENSIKHGILPLKSRGRQGYVEINIYDREDILFIEVKDNGIGIAQAKEKQSLHHSYGLTNIKNRINQLSIILGKEMSFELSDVYDEDGNSGGTLAVIKMPL